MSKTFCASCGDNIFTETDDVPIIAVCYKCYASNLEKQLAEANLKIENIANYLKLDKKELDEKGFFGRSCARLLNENKKLKENNKKAIKMINHHIEIIGGSNNGSLISAIGILKNE